MLASISSIRSRPRCTVHSPGTSTYRVMKARAGLTGTQRMEGQAAFALAGEQAFDCRHLFRRQRRVEQTAVKTAPAAKRAATPQCAPPPLPFGFAVPQLTVNTRRAFNAGESAVSVMNTS